MWKLFADKYPHVSMNIVHAPRFTADMQDLNWHFISGAVPFDDVSTWPLSCRQIQAHITDDWYAASQPHVLNQICNMTNLTSLGFYSSSGSQVKEKVSEAQLKRISLSLPQLTSLEITIPLDPITDSSIMFPNVTSSSAFTQLLQTMPKLTTLRFWGGPTDAKRLEIPTRLKQLSISWNHLDYSETMFKSIVKCSPSTLRSLTITGMYLLRMHSINGFGDI
jgi:hypothetical protein